MKKVNSTNICFAKFVYCVYPWNCSEDNNIGPLTGYLLVKNIVSPNSVAKLLGDDWMFYRTKKSINELSNSNSHHFAGFVENDNSRNIPKSRSAGKFEILEHHIEKDKHNQFENFIII